MSSPLAIEKKGASKKALVGLHQALSHNHRVGVLAQRIAAITTMLVPNGRARCLDIGCGDMTIAEAIQQHAPLSDWRCIDVHPLPSNLQGDPRWKRYAQFNGSDIPFSDQEFDAALLCDVLHHAPANMDRLLTEAGRVARYVIVKDHFEYGPYSRTMLRLMDFVGNWGYGISVPKRYVPRDEFVQLVAKQALSIQSFDCGLKLYEHLPVVRTLLLPDWHFIAVLHR